MATESRSWFDDNSPTIVGPSTTTPKVTAGPVSTLAGPTPGNATTPYGASLGDSFTANPTGTTTTGAPGTFQTGAPNDPTVSSDPAALIGVYLKQGMDPNAAVDAVNKKFNLPSGQSYAYYAPGSHGPGSGAVIGVPGGGYLAPGSDGSWAFNQGDKGAYDNPASNNVTPFSYQPFTDTFSYDKFTAPTDVTEQNDPGYQARLKFGMQTLNNSAAAKGTALSGQTLNDLNQYGQDFASNEYGNVYNRAAQTYASNYGTALQQFQQKWNQYQQGYQNAFQGWGANANLSQTNWQNAFSLAGQQFGMNQQNWQNQYNVAQLGLYAANNAANAGSQYANQAGNIYGNIGNANAAGTVGSANAWSGALGNLANYGASYPYMTSNGSIYGGGGGYNPYGTGGYYQNGTLVPGPSYGGTIS